MSLNKTKRYVDYTEYTRNGFNFVTFIRKNEPCLDVGMVPSSSELYR